MREELRRKMGLQHTTVVWYGGSCTNKHDKLTDTSIQVLHNAEIFGFIYWRSILGWYGQPCHEEWNGKDYSRSIFGWYGRPCCEEWNGEDYWLYIHLARGGWKERRRWHFTNHYTMNNSERGIQDGLTCDTVTPYVNTSIPCTTWSWFNTIFMWTLLWDPCISGP